MKKLNKIQINPARLMKNEELNYIKGGYDGCSCVCYSWDFQLLGVIDGENVNALNCNPLCLEKYTHGYGHWSC